VDIWLNNGTYKAEGAWLDDRSQFDKSSDFKPLTNATGKLTFMADGKTPTDSTRIFHTYFGHTAAAELRKWLP